MYVSRHNYIMPLSWEISGTPLQWICKNYVQDTLGRSMGVHYCSFELVKYNYWLYLLIPSLLMLLLSAVLFTVQYCTFPLTTLFKLLPFLFLSHFSCPVLLSCHFSFPCSIVTTWSHYLHIGHPHHDNFYTLYHKYNIFPVVTQAITLLCILPIYVPITCIRTYIRTSSRWK